MMTGARHDAIQKCSEFPAQNCVCDFVNLRASAENADLNDCIVGKNEAAGAADAARERTKSGDLVL